jgi:hypothetical protein
VRRYLRRFLGDILVDGLRPNVLRSHVAEQSAQSGNWPAFANWRRTAFLGPPAARSTGLCC